MNAARSLHNEAMSFLDKAILAKLEGDIPLFEKYNKLAFEKEKAAATILKDGYQLEPTRSVLYRSAASFAIELGLLEEAEQLAYTALSGNPPHEIKVELKHILEEATALQHLELNGIELDDNDVQVSMAGNSIIPGFIESIYFVRRIEDIQRAFIRTSDRILGLPFQDRPKAREANKMFLGVPRAASFAVTIRLGAQQQLPFLTDGKSTINEFMECVDLITGGEMITLRERINSDDYFSNFVALIKRIAPDGEDIRQVGFTSSVAGREKRVLIRQTTKEISKLVSDSLPDNNKDKEVIETLQGELRFADSTKQKGGLKLVTDSGSMVSIQVPAALMADIVRPYWEQKVEIVVSRKGKLRTLKEILPIE